MPREIDGISITKLVGDGKMILTGMQIQESLAYLSYINTLMIVQYTDFRKDFYGQKPWKEFA